MSANRTDELASNFDRYLEQLGTELESFPDEASVWRVQAGITNSAGTLALHMTGNLLHYVGALLGNTGYVRDREGEFSRRDVPRAELLGLVSATRTVLSEVLGGLDGTALDAEFEGLPDRYKGRTTGWFLMHLSIHLGYHLGQVNYHRRLLGTAG